MPGRTLRSGTALPDTSKKRAKKATAAAADEDSDCRDAASHQPHPAQAGSPAQGDGCVQLPYLYDTSRPAQPSLGVPIHVHVTNGCDVCRILRQRSQTPNSCLQPAPAAILPPGPRLQRSSQQSGVAGPASMLHLAAPLEQTLLARPRWRQTRRRQQSLQHRPRTRGEGGLGGSLLQTPSQMQRRQQAPAAGVKPWQVCTR